MMARIKAAVIVFFIFSGALFFTLTGPLELAKDYSESLKKNFRVQAELKGIQLLRSLSDTSCSSTNTAEDNYKIGEMYWSGQGRTENELEGIKCYELSANSGYIRAQYILGEIYNREPHIDLSSAFKWHKMCATREDNPLRECQYELALLYEKEIPGIAPDQVKYCEFLQKAGDQGANEARIRLTSIYEGDLDKWFKLVVEGDVVDAFHYVGYCYLNATGVGGNLNEARKMWKKAADKNWLSKESKYQLALMFAKGQGGPQDLVEARKLLSEAAKQNHSESQYQLALMHANGQGGAKDYKEARNLLRQAVENGHAAACFELSIMYTNGLGVEKDLIEAHRLLKLAGRRHHTDAQYWLGAIYYHGWAPVERSYGLASWWFAHAALKGHPGARFGLASCYANGLSVRKDEKRAYKLYLSAALAGHRGAQSALKSIRDNKTL